MFSTASPTAQTVGGLAAFATSGAPLARYRTSENLLILFVCPEIGKRGHRRRHRTVTWPTAQRMPSPKILQPLRRSQNGLADKCIPFRRGCHNSQLRLVPHSQRCPVFPSCYNFVSGEAVMIHSSRERHPIRLHLSTSMPMWFLVVSVDQVRGSYRCPAPVACP